MPAFDLPISVSAKVVMCGSPIISLQAWVLWHGTASSISLSRPNDRRVADSSPSVATMALSNNSKGMFPRDPAFYKLFSWAHGKTMW